MFGNSLVLNLPISGILKTITIINRTLFSTPIKKFYKIVSISQSKVEGYDSPVFEIHLDHGKLRTPGGKKFYVPNKFLAHAVAHEWDSQKDTINRYSMHLTSLCNRVLDNESLETTDFIINAIMQYADSDTICFRCYEPDDLVNMQTAVWDPILNWVSERYQIQPVITKSMTTVTKLSQSDRVSLSRHFRSYNRWGLVAIQSCVESLKSVFLTLAALDGHVTASKAVELSQLEQLFQTHRWGEVESYHDIEIAELNARVSAAIVLALVSHHQYHIKTKANRRDHISYLFAD